MTWLAVDTSGSFIDSTTVASICTSVLALTSARSPTHTVPLTLIHYSKCNAPRNRISLDQDGFNEHCQGYWIGNHYSFDWNSIRGSHQVAMLGYWYNISINMCDRGPRFPSLHAGHSSEPALAQSLSAPLLSRSAPVGINYEVKHPSLSVPTVKFSLLGLWVFGGHAAPSSP